jgi:hypothetical protein
MVAVGAVRSCVLPLSPLEWLASLACLGEQGQQEAERGMSSGCMRVALAFGTGTHGEGDNARAR